MQNGRSRRDAHVAALRWLLHVSCAFTVCCLVLAGSANEARAYPWMIKHGYTNCAGCHTDPSGGELLTVYGHAITYEVLSTRFGGSSESSQAAADRRTLQALRRAGGAKSAPKKKVREEKVVLDEEPAPAKAKAKKPAAAKPVAKKPAAKKPVAKPAAAKAKAAVATSEEEATEEEAIAEGEGGEEEAAVEEEGAIEEEAEASTEDSEAGESESAEPSPYEGMSGLTGPLFGLMKPKEQLLLGGSFRFATTLAPETRFFPMQLDLYGQLRLGSRFRAGASVGAAKVPAGSPHARAAQVTGNQEDGYNLISRTHWIGFDFGDGAHTVRAGRLNLPFGLRMSEHVMWVREKTQTDRESDQQHGVAVYMGFDTFRFELMAIAGNFQVNPDQFRERGYSGYAEFVLGEKTTAGINSLFTIAQNDRVYTEGLRTARQAHGFFVRSAVSDPVVIMAEVDALLRSRRELGYVGFLQVDVEAFQGLHLIGTGELLDTGFPKGGGLAQTPRAKGFGKPELAGWLSAQWFFLPHFDFRLDAIFRSETQILGQLHVYL